MRGFSLIEVMVVIAILGVAAAMAVPAMLPEVHKAQLDGDTEAVANFIARARAEAMYSKRCVRVHIGSTATGNIAAGATPTTTLVAERLNSFDCDVVDESSSQTIDSASPMWIQIDFLNSSRPTVTFSLPTVPNSLSGTSNEIRFRPNGRVWSNEALTASLASALPGALNNDDAVLLVSHGILSAEINTAAGQRRVLVQGNGLVCTLNRGVTPTGSPLLCP